MLTSKLADKEVRGSVAGTIVVHTCKLCKEEIIIIPGYPSSYNNFKRHLQVAHPLLGKFVK